METENVFVVILSIFALLISIIAIAGVDLSKSESVDLSGISENEVMITAIQGDVEILQDDTNCDCVITENDLDDLEDDLKKYCRNKCEDGDDGADGVDGINGTSCSVEQSGNCAIISCTDGTNATICNIPVCEYSMVEGTSYAGLYGSMVTPVTITNEDCSTVEALKIEKTQNYQQGQAEGVSAGWAGWSCIDSEYPQVIGGGYSPENADVLNSLAWETGASVGEFNYPITPWGYEYSPGETGWIVQAAGTTPPISIYVLCAA